MPCKGCKHCRNLDAHMVACASMKHARFMDAVGGKRYQQLLQHYGAMPLVSSEALGRECPDFQVFDGKDASSYY